MLKIETAFRIDLFTVFSTFEMDNYHWKERLKISKIAKLESDLLKTDIDTAPQGRESL